MSEIKGYPCLEKIIVVKSKKEKKDALYGPILD